MDRIEIMKKPDFESDGCVGIPFFFFLFRCLFRMIVFRFPRDCFFKCGFKNRLFLQFSIKIKNDCFGRSALIVDRVFFGAS